MEFKDKLKKLRTEKGISQQALADAIHISRSAVAKWENGLGYPSIDSLELLIAYFGVSESYFNTEEPEVIIVTKNRHIQYLRIVIIAVILVFWLVVLFLGLEWIGSVSEDDPEGLTRQAAEYLGYGELEIVEITQRGDYMAALCIDPEHAWSMCVYERHAIFDDRWVASGGKKAMDSGEIESWNYGSPKKEAILIFCGGNLPEDIAYYSFENSGVEYTCPVDDGTVLDLFIILDRGNINGYPIPLNAYKEPIR